VAFQGRALICLVTDRRLVAGEGAGHETTIRRLAEFAREAARAGVDLIQVRERDLEARSLCELVARCVSATAGTGARVLVNDRIDVALAAGAAGVHLRGDAPPACRVRSMTPPGFLIGRSVHSAVEGASLAAQGGLDYLVFGTVFPSASKNPGHPVAGIGALARMVSLVAIPVLAIGGVTPERAVEVARAGAAGVAAISPFAVAQGGGDPGCRLDAVVAGLRAAFDTVRAVT
jgi:thiamine-phosphate pyrophosphorylase